MPISLPKFFQKAFAENGGKQDVPITGDTSGGRASYDAGFPPVTRIPIVAGGIPPFGTDFNGVLYDLSAAIQYVQSGVAFPFNQDFATAIGGYEIGAIVSDSSDKSLLWINGTASNTAFPTGWTQFSFNNATETTRGFIRVGTQSETNAGALDDVAVTPKKLRAGFSFMTGATGWISFPSWLGGFIIQWGSNNIPSATSTTIQFPMVFPSFCAGVCFAPTASQTSPTSTSYISSKNTSSFTLFSYTGVPTVFIWIAIGY